MKPEGIRKVIAEQGVEGAVVYLAEELEKLRAEYEGSKPVAAAVDSEPKTEGEV